MILHPCVEAAVAHMSAETLSQICASVRLSDEVRAFEGWIDPKDFSSPAACLIDKVTLRLFEREGVSSNALDDCFGQEFIDALLQARKRAKAHVA